MPKFIVTGFFYASKSVKVEAKDKDDAEEKAGKDVSFVSLCHHCAKEVELGDCYETKVEEYK